MRIYSVIFCSKHDINGPWQSVTEDAFTNFRPRRAESHHLLPLVIPYICLVLIKHKCEEAIGNIVGVIALHYWFTVIAQDFLLVSVTRMKVSDILDMESWGGLSKHWMNIKQN